MATEHGIIRARGDVELACDIRVPADPVGVVVFAHGSGSSRHSPRNQAVAEHLVESGLATVLADLLTPSEAAKDQITREHRFDIPKLGARVTDAVDWLDTDDRLVGLPLGLFGASTGAAAALIAAAKRPDRVRIVVSRGGRPDLAAEHLRRVTCPVLLIVGERDEEVVTLNRRAATEIAGDVDVHVVPGATHLFEERGALEEVQRVAGERLVQTLSRADPA